MVVTPTEFFVGLVWRSEGRREKGEGVQTMEMRGSGAMRVEKEHQSATCCSLSMLLSDASCCLEVEAPSNAKIQRDLAAAMSTKEILINKQRRRQYRSGRAHALLR